MRQSSFNTNSSCGEFNRGAMNGKFRQGDKGDAMRIRLLRTTNCLLLALLAVFMLTATNRSYGQDINATLSGTVTDPSGAVIPGAKLTLVNEATGFQSSYVSDSGGEYSFGNLTPGKYDLMVTGAGFKAVSQKGIELLVAQRGHSDVHLTVGQADQTVEVSADTSLINFETQTLEGGVSPETLQAFPLVVGGAPRSAVAIATMMPGVTSAGGNNAFNARINGGIITGDEAIVDGVTTSEGFMNQSGMVALQTDFGMSPTSPPKSTSLRPTTTPSTATPPPVSSSFRPRVAVSNSMAADTNTSATTSSTLSNTAPPSVRPTRKTTSALLSVAPGMFRGSTVPTQSSRATSTSTGKGSRITVARFRPICPSLQPTPAPATSAAGAVSCGTRTIQRSMACWLARR